MIALNRFAVHIVTLARFLRFSDEEIAGHHKQ